MIHLIKKLSLVVLSMLISVNNVNAEIKSATAGHYELHHQAQSKLSSEALWKKLLQPSQWWHPNHTYSGDSANLSLDAQAGGYWREDWKGNSVLHGTVLQIQQGKILVLNAPFGPLQGMAVNVIWTITLKATEDGTTQVTFSEIANGAPSSKLDEIAKAVDFVKREALNRLIESDL